MKSINSKNTRKFILVIITLVTLISSAESQIAKDKQMHLGAGAVIGGWSYMMPSDSKSWKPIIYGIGGATLAGAGKELSDMAGLGTPDWKDFGATVIGGVITVGVIHGVRTLIKRNRRYDNRHEPRLFALGR